MRGKAPWWSFPARPKSWSSHGIQGASYSWHDICREAVGLGAALSRVAPAPETPTPSCEAEKGSQHLLEVSDLLDPRALAKYLIEAEVGLVRAQYFWKLRDEAGSIPRRQEVEDVSFQFKGSQLSCLVSSEELLSWAEDDSHERPRIFAISHCWESREHPDPCGYQLGLIDDYTRRCHHAFDCEMWIFYDYISLCQYQRNNQQDRHFRRAMQQMHLLYAHNSTTTLRIESLTPDAEVERCRAEDRQIWAFVAGQLRLVSLKNLSFQNDHGHHGPCKAQCFDLHGNRVPYSHRGWCEAEAQWSAMRGRSHSSIQIDVATGRYQVKAPMPPELFRRRVFEKGLTFTWRSDLAQVLDLQEEIFKQKARSCEELLQKGLPNEEFLTLAVALRCFAKLKVLHLRKCQIRELGADALAKGLQSLRARNVKIICSDIDGLKFMVKALSAGLQGNEAVTELDLSGQSFSHRTAELVEDAEAKALSAAVRHGALRQLSLACNDIGPEGAKALAEALKTPSCTLVDLNLEGNHIGPEGAQALVEALQINQSVIRICVADNELPAQNLEALMEALEHRTKLSQLRVTTSTSKALGNVQAMSESLRMNGTSTHLQLKCRMGDATAKALASSLAVNSSVTHINWAGNKIGDEGAQALASALRLNRTVRFIDLSGNRIGDRGAKAFAKVLQENSSIQQINLKNNQIGAKGRQALESDQASENRALL